MKADLGEQSRRVQGLLETAFDAAFAGDAAGAKRAIAMDEIIDRVDVDLEKAAVQLLIDATREGSQLAPEHLRLVLTIVKVNNELERIADAGVAVAESVPSLIAQKAPLPDTLRVITNSVVGILRDASGSLERNDPALAKIVLASEDAVEEFKKAILRDLTSQVASRTMTVELAFRLQELTTLCEAMAAHCTNIAEQALYLATGKIVRHMGGHWEEVPQS
jgi:phosphate transport system protein